MRVILFGATGMLGQGVLRECLLDKDVTKVLAIGRSATSQKHEKFRELALPDLFQLESLGSELDGYDVCLYALGATSVGRTEAEYRRVTLELTVSIAEALLGHNPGMKFLFISGDGADSSGKSKVMWARVKGEAENAILAMPFSASYVFRPSFVQPLHGSLPQVPWMRTLYFVMTPLIPALRFVAPKKISTTEELGKAMLRVAKNGFKKRILVSGDFRDAQ